MSSSAPDGGDRGGAPTALQPGRRLRLEDDAAGAVCVAEVAEMRTDALVVRLLDPPPPGAFRRGTSVDLTLTAPDGLYRSTTTVDGGTAGTDDDDEVLDLRPPADFEVVQRRAQPRVDVSFAVTVRRVSPGRHHESVTAQAEDLSPGGIRLDSVAPFDVGHVLELELPGDDGAVTLQGLVVASRPRHDGHRTLHVAFSRFGDETLDLLQRLVNRRGVGAR